MQIYFLNTFFIIFTRGAINSDHYCIIWLIFWLSNLASGAIFCVTHLVHVCAF